MFCAFVPFFLRTRTYIFINNREKNDDDEERKATAKLLLN